MASRQNRLTLSAVAFAAVLLPQAMRSAGAAPIFWSTPTTISGNGSQVLTTTGSVVAAVRFGSSGAVGASSVTVNGVTFLTGTLGAATVTGSTGNLSYVASANGNTPIAQTQGVSGTIVTNIDYRNLVGNGMQVQGQPINFTISGLTSGIQYVIQYWANQSTTTGVDGSNTSSVGRSVRLTGPTTSGTANIDINVGDVTGNTGQFVTGTFTADGSTQGFTATGLGGTNTRTYVSAVQVRVVPEPGTMAMAALGVVGIGAWVGRRRTRRAADASSAADAVTSA